MSAFFDQASLVVVPSGYKSGKIYAQKPLTTDGQLTFTRASNATRVASNGLIEKVRTNLALYSQDFSQTGTWVSSTTTRVDSQTDPNGGTTASKFTATGANSNVIQTLSVSSGVPYTWSFWAKSDSATNVNIRLDNNNGNFVQANMALTTSWQRFSITLNSTATTILCFLGGGVSFTAGEIAYMAFAQLELGDIATQYLATTTAPVSTGPVSGLPRLDYLNSSCPRLLLEPQRTNLCVFSEDYTNAVWSKFGTTVTANNGTSPDGYNSADLVVEDTSAGVHGIERATSPAPGTYTFSAFLKKGTRRYSGVRAVTNGYSNRYFALVDLDTGLVVSTNTIGTGVTWSHTVEAYANGWYRLSITGTHTSGNISLFLALSATDSPTYFGGAPSYTGSTSENGLFWGCQIEVASYASSYIPTLSTSVTRVADAASKTGIASLIGQTAGTLFVDFTFGSVTSENRQIFQLSDGSGNNLHFRIRNSNELQAYGTGNFSPFDERLALTKGGRYKVALGYSNGDFAYYVNGVQIATDTQSTTASNLSEMYLGINNLLTTPLGGTISQALLFKTRLTNAALQELTTL